MQTLDSLGVKYNTDKSSKCHCYLDIYEKYFGTYRNKSFSLLEIGILGGSSLKMWEEYFSKANIYGIDINEMEQYNTERTKCYKANQESREELINVVKSIKQPSIIIDDGGHTMQQQQITLACLFPLLKKNGIYIIEDLHTSYNKPRKWNNTYTKLTTLEVLKKLSNKEKISSDFMTPEEITYIEKNTLSCTIEKGLSSEICFIKKL